MSQQSTTSQIQETGNTGTTHARGTNWLLSFTGLIPVVIIIPIIILQLWTVAIIVNIALTVLVIGYHLSRKQNITSLDIVSLLFGVVNAVLYFGFHNTTLLAHLDIVIYTMLFIQVIYSLIIRQPWTEQYAKRAVSPELWNVPAFHRSNQFLTILWSIVFLACDLIAIFVSAGLWHTLLPVILLVALAVMTPRLGRIAAYL